MLNTGARCLTIPAASPYPGSAALRGLASSDKVVRVGVLGTGRVVSYALLLPARQTAGIEVTAVASRSLERAQGFARANGIPHAFGSYEELLADESVDAVYVALPTALHCIWARRALKHGKDVLCEKPLGVNADVIKRAINDAQEMGRVLQEGMHLRHSRLLRRAREIMRSGQLGEIVRVESYFMHPDVPMEQGDFRLSYELGGGACLDLGCYAIACLRQVTDEQPSVVSARSERIAPQIDRWMRATVKFPSGADGTIECGFQGPYAGRFGLTIECKRGTLTLDATTGLSYTKDGQAVQEPNPGDWTYKLQLDEFLGRVGRQKASESPAGDPLGTAQIIDAMYESSGMLPRTEGHQILAAV